MEQEMFLYYKNALSNGLCDEYKSRWRACGDDKEKLVKLVMEQQSIPHFIYYSYNGMGLSKEYLLKEFKDYINGKYIVNDADGVQGYTYSLYVAFKGIFKPTTDVVAMLWVTNSHVEIKATKAPILYVGAGSHIHLSLEGYNSPKIYLFDDSKIELVDADENSKVIIYKYSNNADITIGKYCLAEVKVFEKELKI